MVYAAMFGALTAVGAFISIPLYPVPITLQTLFTALAGLLLGGYYGALSQVVYVLLGVMGLPLFNGGKSGLGVLLGPTGGYLVGFVLGAYVTGRIAQARKNPGIPWLCLSVALGYAVVYAAGITQLSFVAHLSLRKALLVGVLPFVIGDILKCAAAGLLASRIRKQPFFAHRPGPA
jgi:biotin transport system substrate-specific component